MKSKQKSKGIKLRIIGGQLGGRVIQYHGADFTRPMKDNIRENLFNIIGPSIRGAKCFDLFAGTGALGLESISRGATSAVMIEQNRIAAKLIEQTIDQLELRGKARVLFGDAFRFGDQLLAPPEDDTPWCVFFCPPYAMWTSDLDSLNRMIRKAVDNAPPGSMVIAETEKRFDREKLASTEWDFREYGATRLAIARPAMVCGMTL